MASLILHSPELVARRRTYEPPVMTPELTQMLYRIAQEALTHGFHAHVYPNGTVQCLGAATVYADELRAIFDALGLDLPQSEDEAFHRSGITKTARKWAPAS